MGSAELACPCVDSLIAYKDVELVAVVTQPDRPKGRSQRVSACPVKAHLSKTSTVRILTPENINTEESVAELSALEPDLIVVVAYGQILRKPILEMAEHRCVNVHASLLPKYRGASPVQSSIVSGESVTGVTTMYMEAGVDTGAMILKSEEPIRDDDTAGSLHDRLAERGAALLSDTIDLILAGSVDAIPQDHEQATMAPKLSKTDGYIDWSLLALDIVNKVRGFNPWPICSCVVPGGGRLRVLSASVVDGVGTTGSVIEISDEGPVIAVGDGAVLLLQVQPEGGKPMSASAYLRGHALELGSVLS